MYKNFHNSIKCFSLVMGHLNLLRSLYYSAANGYVEDKSYIAADLAVVKFRNFCKKTIKEIEKLLSDQDSKVMFDVKDLDKIRKLTDLIKENASDGIIDDLYDNLNKINHFIDFLINDFPKKNLNQVDLKGVKNEVIFFKYQIYLS